MFGGSEDPWSAAFWIERIGIPPVHFGQLLVLFSIRVHSVRFSIEIPGELQVVFRGLRTGDQGFLPPSS